MTDASARRTEELTQAIGALRAAIAPLAALPDLRRPLEVQLAAYEHELAMLHAGAAASARSHIQHINGNARVGTALAGDVYGGITLIHQSGGVNNGSGNTINHTGDVVAGDQTRTPSAPDLLTTPAESRHQQLAAHRARLAVLEQQQATFGFNTRPEIVTEIAAIRARIAELQQPDQS